MENHMQNTQTDDAQNNHTAKLSYTIKEYCAATGLSRSTVYRLANAGKLRFCKLGNRTLIKYQDGKRLIDEL
ncbi:MAG: hypothetical protein COB46_07635 [Rhodospirillaceae bacterium]|nr:MAG: hypothetical protein COB46_07635 [Rhodospirillaceae bacterium]